MICIDRSLSFGESPGVGDFPLPFHHLCEQNQPTTRRERKGGYCESGDPGDY